MVSSAPLDRQRRTPAAGHAGGAAPTLAVCGLIHESNAFAAAPTVLGDFTRLDAEAIRAIGPGSGTEVGGALLAGDEMGAIVEPTSVALATSSGLVEDEAAETLVHELVDRIEQLASRGRLDAVVACMHGSMCSESDPDVEGTALGRLRRVLGPDVALVATLDWHASITAAMVDATHALVAYRTYPHIDQEARGKEAARLALGLAGAGDLPYARWIPIPMMIAGPGTRDDHPAMASLLATAQDMAGGDDRIATWSVVPGFARSDNASSGSHVYVAGSEAQAVDSMAEKLANDLWGARGSFDADLVGLNAALERTESLVAQGVAPVVLADQGDNPGGGAPGDSTVVLEALERLNLSGALIASLCAPAMVTHCHRAGVGACLRLRIGGFDGEVEVRGLVDGRYTIRSPTHPNVPFDVGPGALVRSAGGVDIVLTSKPVQNEDLQFLEMLGVDPRNARVIVVKSNVHFRAAFDPIAAEVIDLDTPGISTPNLARLPYRHVRRPTWPLDRDMTWDAP